GQHDHDLVGRHEATRDDRQGAGARAADPVPRRTDCGRRRRAAQGHVADRARAARRRGDHHPHHALHRGSRGDGRPHRHHQQGRNHPGGRQGRAGAQAWQEATGAASDRQDQIRPAPACRLSADAHPGRRRADLPLRYPGRAHRHHRPAPRRARGGHPLSRPAHHAEFARRHLRRHGERAKMNWRAVLSIYKFEMARTGRTLMQSILSPVISTCLYFVVFGAAIGSRISQIEGVSYGAFIVPGLVMMMLLTQSVMNASFGIYFPRFIGTIYELLSAPVSFFEIALGYVGAAASKSIILGVIILITANLFVPLRIAHPAWMVGFLVLTAVSFSLLGFIIGIWADGFEKLQVIPLLVITPLTFLGGSFYSVNVLPPVWQTVSLFNPVVYLISGFRWSFFEIADVGVGVSLAMTTLFLAVCLVIIWWIFKTGYRLKQ